MKILQYQNAVVILLKFSDHLRSDILDPFNIVTKLSQMPRKKNWEQLVQVAKIYYVLRLKSS